MKGAGQILIETILFLTIYLLTGRIFLKNGELNADNSFKIYLDKINMLLDAYALLKRINKCNLKFAFKSIPVKNKLLTNFINKRALY